MSDKTFTSSRQTASWLAYCAFTFVGIGLLVFLFRDTRHPWSKAPPPRGASATQVSLAEGARLFQQNCAICHGAEGKGMQNLEWKTEEGLPIVSRNLRSGVFKGGGRCRDLYTRSYAGIPGTPMPTFNTLKDEDIWRLVHFVEALA